MTLEEKIAADAPLNIGEICKVTGISRLIFRRINPPMVAGRIRLSQFKEHEKQIAKPKYE